MRMRDFMVLSSLFVLPALGLPGYCQQKSTSQPQAGSKLLGSVSGRVFGITGAGDLKPARFAHVYLLFEWSGKSKASHGKDNDSQHAYLAYLDKQNEEMKKMLAEPKGSDGDDALLCRKSILVVVEAVSYALNWSQENRRANEFMSVDTDEEGSFRISGVPAGIYFIVVHGRAGANEAIWSLDNISIKAGSSVSVKLPSPEEACVVLPE